MSQAKFISIEGIEGVGKSTAVAFICDYLRDNNIELLQTREPGGSELAEKIRQILLSNEAEQLHVLTELLLMFAARKQNIETLIKPTLAANKWLICDRFVDASFAYQGGGRGLEINMIEQLSTWVCAELKPDVTFLLDAPVDLAMSRLKQAGKVLDRIELEQQDFFARVREQYLQMATAEPQRFVIIDASQSITAVQADLKKHLDGLLEASC